MADNALLSLEFLIYKDLVEASPDLVCRFLPDTTVTFANEALCRALEIERSDLLGRRFFELIPEEEIEPVGDTLASLSPERAFCRMAGCSRDETLGKLFEEVFPVAHGAGALHLKHLVERADSGEPVVEEGVLATKNGRRLFLSVLALPVPDTGESGKGTYLFFRDMTALKENESQLIANIGKLHAAFSQTVEVLAFTVESRDPYTAGHQRRTALLSREIARRMGLDEETCCGIFLAAAIHDVGKISVPSEILSRPGKLLDIELSLVKTHAEEGYKILNKVDFPWKIAEIVRQHHERLDGSGYPRGLKNDDIVLEAKIIAVADTVEAMASHRPYRPSLGIETALRFVEEGKGRLFNRLVVEKCQVLFDEGYAFDDCYAPAELLQ